MAATILTIEDEPEFAALVELWMSRAGYRTVTARTEPVNLTPTEFRLLAHLMEHAGQLATHRQILGAVWGSGYDRDVHLLRMTIRNLRLKLDAVAPGDAYVTTEFGLGYRLAGTRGAETS